MKMIIPVSISQALVIAKIRLENTVLRNNNIYDFGRMSKKIKAQKKNGGNNGKS